MKKILVIGNSHMHALEPIPSAHAGFDFVSQTVPERDHARRERAEFEALAAAGYESVVLMLGGARHIVLGMVNSPQPFDFYLPEQPGLPVNPAARILPVDLVASVLRRHLASELAIMGQLASLFRHLPLYHVESPPPLPAGHIEHHPAGFADVLRERGLSPASLRHKFWLLHSRLVREHCARLDVNFVAAPPVSLDQDGCLRQAYLRNDPTHANTAYGVLVLNQLCALHGRPPVQ